MSMYAIIETGGKQIRVSPGQKVVVEKLSIPDGEKVVFDKVLLLRDESSVRIGNPYLDGISVAGQIVGHVKGKKVIIFKHKRRKNYRKKIGHRQPLTIVTIQSIDQSGGNI